MWDQDKDQECHKEATRSKSNKDPKASTIHELAFPFYLVTDWYCHSNSWLENEHSGHCVRTMQAQSGDLQQTTVDGWIDWTGDHPCWSDAALEKIRQGNNPGHNKVGWSGVFVAIGLSQEKLTIFTRHLILTLSPLSRNNSRHFEVSRCLSL